MDRTGSENSGGRCFENGGNKIVFFFKSEFKGFVIRSYTKFWKAFSNLAFFRWRKNDDVFTLPKSFSFKKFNSVASYRLRIEEYRKNFESVSA